MRMVPPAVHSSWVVHPAEQFLFIVLEFQEYYKEKCRSHTATPAEQFVYIVLEFQQCYNKNCTVYSQFVVVVWPQTVHVSPMKC